MSGPGSDFDETRRVTDSLPKVFKRLDVSTLIDCPCGDGNWIRHINSGLDWYLGLDIVPQIVAALQQEARENESFDVFDLVCQVPPKADAILIRDLLVHLPLSTAVEALANAKASGARYLIATTFPIGDNVDCLLGDWRPINLELSPFSLGPPIEIIYERTDEDAKQDGKALGVWLLR